MIFVPHSFLPGCELRPCFNGVDAPGPAKARVQCSPCHGRIQTGGHRGTSPSKTQAWCRCGRIGSVLLALPV